MRRFVLLIAAMAVLGPYVGAQDTIAVEDGDVLIVPFEPKMYRSTIDPAISQSSGVDYREVRNKLRHGLDDNLVLEIKVHDTPKSLLRLDTGGYRGDLARIYNSIGYNYEILPAPKVAEEPEENEEAKPLDKLANKLDNLFTRKKQPKADNQRMGTWVQDGQLVGHIDNREKYMKTVIADPSLIRYLCEKYEVTRVLFINQLDLLEVDNEFEEKRKINVHFTAFDRTGQVISSGMETSYFSSYVNDLDEIINQKLYPTTNGIAAKL